MNKKSTLIIFWLVTVLFAVVGELYAAPDYYYGDASVYTGTTTTARPNIMFLIDNSGAMKDMGTIDPYDPRVDYGSELDDPYPREQVYLRNVANENITNYQTQGFVVDEIECTQLTDTVGDYADDVFVGVAGYGTDDDGDVVYADGTDSSNDTYQEVFSGDGFDDSTGFSHPRFALEQNGFWYGALSSKGECPNNQNQWENYYTGNFRNYLESVTITSAWTANTAYEIGVMVTDPDEVSGLILVCTEAGTSGSSSPWGSTELIPADLAPDDLVTDGVDTDTLNPVTWKVMGTVLEMVQDQMRDVVFHDVRNLANMGLMTYGDNNHGGSIIVPVVKAGESDPNGTTNYNALIDGLVDLEDLVNGNTQPVNESMWDAYLYWVGKFGNSDMISSDNNTYDSPIEHWCQSNHLVILTTGSAGNNSQTKTKVENEAGTDSGDLTGDGEEGLVDDLAVLMQNYLDLEVDGFQPKVNTHIIQLMTPEVQRLRTTAEQYGDGIYRNINNPGELLEALTDIIAGILEADSSFVAPVVPASPENRAYSGKRIYLGFFKPMNDEPWYGNLKKFGLNYSSQITAYDFNSTYEEWLTNQGAIDAEGKAVATDEEGYFYADSEGNPFVSSYWSEIWDGGLVDSGGVGDKLLSDGANARAIYTRVGSENDLSATENLFKVNVDEGGDATPNISPYLLGLAESEEAIDDAANEEAVKLINFVRGLDAYADFSNDTTSQRNWILGDIMHSKPVVFNYESYEFNEDNEADDSVNKSYIFVGANDGMLHAFRDADGSEAWAFIPSDLLGNLQYLRDIDHHYYFVDNSPVIYAYDADGDGTIETGDKVILICGMRRGGGTNLITGGAQGSYFALDITDPEDPQFLWEINSDTTGFSELGQTWSLPRLTKMKIGSAIKVVAIFGAGYDTNEDLRYGNTQEFPDAGASTNTSAADQGAEDVSSTDGNGPYLPSGRGVYIVEVATLGYAAVDGGEEGEVAPTVSLASSPVLLWSYTNTDDSTNMTYPIPSDPLVIDRNSDGFTDHIYIGDTGGQLWRFNVASTSTGDWDGTLIFKSNNPDDDDDTDDSVGRKIFYKPTATVKGDDTFIYFGTGDREHPLNTAVTDRFYVVRDRENVESGPWPLTEENLVDVTLDQLQASAFNPLYDEDGAADNGDATLLAKLTGPYYTDGTDTYYGWYIKLVEIESAAQVNYGEKVLAVPKVFNGVVFFSTYTPITPSDADDPCVGQLGPAYLYAVTADTAEAVYNFYSDNDTTDEDGNEVEVLEREDRRIGVGDGIATEPIVLVNSKGAVSVMVGRGGGFFNTGEVEAVDPVFPVYWMKW